MAVSAHKYRPYPVESIYSGTCVHCALSEEFGNHDPIAVDEHRVSVLASHEHSWKPVESLGVDRCECGRVKSWRNKQEYELDG